MTQKNSLLHTRISLRRLAVQSKHLKKPNSSPQLEEGYTRIANEFIEGLCKIRLGGYERRVLDAIIRKTWGFQKKEDRISNSQICEMTGLHKAHVSRSLHTLKFLNIVTKNGNKWGIQKRPNLWIDPAVYTKSRTKPSTKLPKMVTDEKVTKFGTGVTKNGNSVTKNGNKKLPNLADTKEKKETITKETITKENNSMDFSSEKSEKTDSPPFVEGDTFLGVEALNTLRKTDEKAFNLRINRWLGMFKPINPSYTKFFANKTQRKGLEEILVQVGEKKMYYAFTYIYMLPDTPDYKYAPTITTPLQLQDKYAALQDYCRKHMKGKIKSSIRTI